jgi:hypothetical protein
LAAAGLLPNWQQRDDYDFSPGEGDCAGGGGGPGAGGASLLLLLRDLPLPSGDVPGMTDEEAIEVLHTTHYLSCHTSYYVTYMTCYVV